MSISSGTYSVGNITTDYASLADALADVDSGGLTGDLTFVVYGGYLEYATEYAGFLLNGYTYTIKGLYGNNGYRDTGSRITAMNSASISGMSDGSSLGGTLVLEDITFLGSDKTLTIYANASTTGCIDIYIRRTMFDRVSLSLPNGTGTWGGDDVIINNNVFVYSYFSTGSSVTAVFENNSVDGTTTTNGIVSGGSSTTLTNNVVFGSSGDNISGTYTDGGGNATVDSTGSSGLTSIVTSTEFVSTSILSSDYLVISDSSVYLFGSGVTPTYSTTDIVGRPRPWDDALYSIGAREYRESTTVTYYDYSPLSSVSIDWGDGTTTTDFFGTHTYSSPGIYTITITVTNGQGDTGVLYRKMDVGLSGEITTASIDWGDGQQTTGLSGTHVYASPDIYTVVLSVENDLGETHDHTFAIYIGGENVGYYLDFGDGQSSTQPNTTHVYTSRGVYTWILRDGDENGTIIDTGTVTITGDLQHVTFFMRKFK